MLGAFKELTANQYEAAFCALNACVDSCPESSWNAPVARYPFSQVVFHTLFFTDYYLGPSEAGFRNQPFHREHEEFFADYEQLQEREPVSVYEKEAIKKYLRHCRAKASEVIAAETTESLEAEADFQRRDFSRAELHVYTIRHIQHHAAQLMLRLRIDTEDVDFPWFGSGWRDA